MVDKNPIRKTMEGKATKELLDIYNHYYEEYSTETLQIIRQILVSKGKNVSPIPKEKKELEKMSTDDLLDLYLKNNTKKNHIGDIENAEEILLLRNPKIVSLSTLKKTIYSVSGFYVILMLGLGYNFFKGFYLFITILLIVLWIFVLPFVDYLKRAYIGKGVSGDWESYEKKEFIKKIYSR